MKAAGLWLVAGLVGLLVGGITGFGDHEALAQDAATEAALDPAEVAFRARFGREIDAAAETETLEDDAVLAGAFVAVIEGGNVPQALVVRLCERAVQFGSKHPVGHPHAIAALRKLQELYPQKRRELQQRIIELSARHLEAGGDTAPSTESVIDLFMQFALEHLETNDAATALSLYERALTIAGNAQSPTLPTIQRRISETNALIKRQAEIAALVAELEAKPGDKAIAMQIVSYHLFERDKPADAMPWIDATGDSKLRSMAQLAATPFADLSILQALELGDWYALRGDDRANPNRPGMYIRAKTYYEQYLSQHETQDATRKKTLDALSRVDRELGKLNIGPKLAQRMVRKLRGEKEQEREHDPAIAAAIEKGVAWLYTQQKDEQHWDEGVNTTDHKYGGYTSLVAYALLMAGEDPRLNNNLRRAVDWVFSIRMNGMYAICFRAHMWEVLPENERYRNVIRDDVSRLQRAAGGDGTFNYDVGNRRGNGDVSTTLAGYLTLWLAKTGGIQVSDAPWQRVVGTLIETQKEDGSWAYKPDPKRQPSGSMTAAGLTVMLMAMDHLTDAQKAVAQASLDNGMGWMDWHFAPDRNPNGSWKNYYLAAVQHVGLLSHRKMFNNMDWYQSAADHLVKTQRPDGSWGDVQETAFAVIFLSRGTVAFDSQGAESPGAAQ